MSQEELIDQLFKEAITAIRAGDKAAGRENLMKVIELNEFHEHAWMWLGATVDSDEERIICLENVLTINPQNEKARQVLEKLRSKQPASAPTIPPAPGSSVAPPPAEPEPASATTPAAPGDDSWRTSLYTEPADEGTVTRAKSRRREALDEEAEYGLGDAWFGALIFKISGAYESVVERAAIGQTLINVALVAFLSAIITVLMAQIILIPSGGVTGLMADSYTQSGMSMTAQDLEAFRQFDQWMGTAGMVAIGAVMFIATPLGLLLTTAMYHAGAKILGGKGDFMQTASGVSLAYVAQTIMQIIPTILAIATLLISNQLEAAMMVMNLGYLVLGLYGLAVMVVAVMTAHQFNFLRALGSIFLAPIVLSVLCCCLSFGLSMLGGAGSTGY
ncbi:MAG: YIP1 family protein [Anaerolineae bacterium]|nr:YIP1 family protein [Anaerolineae bacterium]